MTRLSSYLTLLALLLTIEGVSHIQPQQPASQLNEAAPIPIGLLLPDQSHSGVIAAAQLAIRQANAGGGYMNRPFSLVVRTAEGFWGAGSKESVSLVYEDNVVAIIGSLDGRNGHLAEQVAAKSHLTYMETYATDATLSQAFVPWFMRVVPNDDQQSSIILKQINGEGGGKTALLIQEDYDTRYAARSLTREIAQATGLAPLLLDPDTTSIYQDEIIEAILSNEIENLVIPFHAGYLEELIISLRKVKPGLRIYGTLHFASGALSREPDWRSYEGVCMVAPLLDRIRYPYLPDYRSAYLYDAVNIVISAVRQAGPDRQAITTCLSQSGYPMEATGSISFDEMGNRQGVPTLIRIENGKPRLIRSSAEP
jgi:ABC-type branched-subunit amino acid transport system substrate-binding protein